MKHRFLFTALAFAAALATAHAEATFPQIPEADHAAIRGVTLDDAELARLVAVYQDASIIRTNHLRDSRFSTMVSNSLDDLADRWMAPEPRMARIVQRNGFDTREYLTAFFALASARAVSVVGADKEGGLHNQFVSSVNATPQNVAFYRAHKAQVDTMFDAPSADGNPVSLLLVATTP